jgi:hypothetical protein
MLSCSVLCCYGEREKAVGLVPSRLLERWRLMCVQACGAPVPFSWHVQYGMSSMTVLPRHVTDASDVRHVADTRLCGQAAGAEGGVVLRPGLRVTAQGETPLHSRIVKRQASYQTEETVSSDPST